MTDVVDVGSLRSQHSELLREIGRAIDGSVKAILGSAAQRSRDTRIIKNRTGKMRAGWQWMSYPTRHGAFGSMWNPVAHALYQEKGTGVFGPNRAPYWIEAKRARCLRFVSASGAIIFRRRVLHYGVHPRYIGRAAMYGRDAMFFGEDHSRNIELINRWLSSAAK
jgi:hypothetical protein